MLKINEVHGLFVDHYLTDRTGDLLFISLWGRDTAVRELQARLSLPASEQGLRSLSLETGTRCRIGDINDYRQETGRVPPSRSVFGGLIHLWLYSHLAVEPDRPNHRALLLYRDVDAVARQETADRLWKLVQELSSVPLLDHWRGPVMEYAARTGMIVKVSGATGISAAQVAMVMHETDEDLGLGGFITQSVRSGLLTAQVSS